MENTMELFSNQPVINADGFDALIRGIHSCVHGKDNLLIIVTYFFNGANSLWRTSSLIIDSVT